MNDIVDVRNLGIVRTQSNSMGGKESIRYELLLGFVAKILEEKDVSFNNSVRALTASIFSGVLIPIFLWRMENCSFDVKERILLAVDNMISF